MKTKSDGSTAHSHYYKDVSGLSTIDVYRVLDLFGVTDPCLQHATKKLLVAGGRGHKDIERDVQDAIDSLVRWQDMRREESLVRPEANQLNTRKLEIDYNSEQSKWGSGGDWFNAFPTITIPRTVQGPDVSFDGEERMAPIGQNGNDGEHYDWISAPSWVMYMAEDSNGQRWQYEMEPVPQSASWWAPSGISEPVGGVNGYNENWRNTLQKRPTNAGKA